MGPIQLLSLYHAQNLRNSQGYEPFKLDSKNLNLKINLEGMVHHSLMEQHVVSMHMKFG